MACLVSELLDLESLLLYDITWGSLPTELPRRRPRANHSTLDFVSIEGCNVKGTRSPSFLFASFTLLDVYTLSYHFSADIVALIDALLCVVASQGDLTTGYNSAKRPDGCANEISEHLWLPYGWHYL